eukprot:TRINITY_DN8100_c0_g2_i1.p1 TRINITY_DN8100_c0_g2~~TRINITY_DN8100_c0_g2_i1.p1  ORF type:complete len:238 (-),score=45.51 TRINITY_DN8100_c0_g2_i1:385-1098(-)
MSGTKRKRNKPRVNEATTSKGAPSSSVFGPLSVVLSIVLLLAPWTVLPGLVYSFTFSCAQQQQQQLSLLCTLTTQSLRPSLISPSGDLHVEIETVHITDIETQFVVAPHASKKALGSFRGRPVFEVVLLPSAAQHSPDTHHFNNKNLTLPFDGSQKTATNLHQDIKLKLSSILLTATTTEAEVEEKQIYKFELWGWQHKQVLGGISWISQVFGVLLALFFLSLQFASSAALSSHRRD